MSIQRTKAGGYEVSVCVRRQRLHRRLPPGTTASEAKRVEAELRTALSRNVAPVIPGDPLLTEVMSLYIGHISTLRSPTTAEYHALRIGERLEGHRASHARAVVAKIVEDMQPVYAPATINRSLGALKKALKLAWEKGLTPVDRAGVEAVAEVPAAGDQL